MKTQSSNLLLAIVTCLLLNACGTKGPLYIPEQQYPQDVSKDAPEDTSKQALEKK